MGEDPALSDDDSHDSDDTEDPEDPRSFWEILKSGDAWKKAFSCSKAAPKKLRNFIAGMFVCATGTAVFVPYIRHHSLGWMNGHLVETISGTLATHPTWTKTWGTIGALFGLLSFHNVWKSWVGPISCGKCYGKTTKTVGGVELVSNGCDKGKCCDATTSAVTNKWLEKLTIIPWAISAIGQLGVLWFPIGGMQSTMHKHFVPVAFIPAALGMILFSIFYATKKKKNWKTCTFSLLILCASITGLFAVAGPFFKEGKNQFKMTQDDCIAEFPGNADVCTAKQNTLKNDSEWGNCRPKIPNYGAPKKTKYGCDVEGATSKEYETACNAAVNGSGEQCYFWGNETKLTGWYKPNGDCTTGDEDLQGNNDACHEASARNADGFIDNDAFETSCAATKDTAGNQCEYTPASVSEKNWTIWSVLEILGYGASFIAHGFMHFT